MAWLNNLQSQVSSHLHPKPTRSVAELIEQGRWMAPAQVMHLVQAAYTRARAAVLRCLSSSSRLITRQDAVVIMEAAFCCMMVGFIPPCRPSVAISLTRPTYTGEQA